MRQYHAGAAAGHVNRTGVQRFQTSGHGAVGGANSAIRYGVTGRPVRASSFLSGAR